MPALQEREGNGPELPRPWHGAGPFLAADSACAGIWRILKPFFSRMPASLPRRPGGVSRDSHPPCSSGCGSMAPRWGGEN